MTRIYRCRDCEPGLIVAADPGKIAEFLERHEGHDVRPEHRDDPVELEGSA